MRNHEHDYGEGSLEKKNTEKHCQDLNMINSTLPYKAERANIRITSL